MQFWDINKVILLIGMLFILHKNHALCSYNTSDGTKAIDQTTEISLRKINFCKDEFSKILNDLSMLNKSLSLSEQLKLSELETVLNQELKAVGNAESITKLLNGFKIASLKIELASISDDAYTIISELEVQKIKLCVLYDLYSLYKANKRWYVAKTPRLIWIKQFFNKELRDPKTICTIYENLVRKHINNLINTIVTKALSKYKLKTPKQDFYSEQLVLADQYLNLIELYTGKVLRNQKLDSVSFFNQIDELIKKLLLAKSCTQEDSCEQEFPCEQEFSCDQEFISITDKLVLKLMHIRDQITTFDKTQTEIPQDNIVKINLFLEYKTLLQNPKFKTFRTNKDCSSVCSIFVNTLSKYFLIKDKEQCLENFINLLELEKLILSLEEQFKPIEPTTLIKIINYFGNYKRTNEIYVIKNMLSIVSNAINEIGLMNKGSNGNGIFAGGLNLLGQLKKVGIDNSLFITLSNAFFNKKFNNMFEIVSFVAAQTGPIWLQKIIPGLPEDIQATASAVLKTLVEARQLETSIDTQKQVAVQVN